VFSLHVVFTSIKSIVFSFCVISYYVQISIASAQIQPTSGTCGFSTAQIFVGPETTFQSNQNPIHN